MSDSQLNLTLDLKCEGCGAPLTNCGPIGWTCVVDGCDAEFQLAIKAMRTMTERHERAELARLKAKYEGDGK